MLQRCRLHQPVRRHKLSGKHHQQRLCQRGPRNQARAWLQRSQQEPLRGAYLALLRTTLQQGATRALLPGLLHPLTTARRRCRHQSRCPRQQSSLPCRLQPQICYSLGSHRRMSWQQSLRRSRVSLQLQGLQQEAHTAAHHWHPGLLQTAIHPCIHHSRCLGLHQSGLSDKILQMGQWPPPLKRRQQTFCHRGCWQ